MFYVLNAGMIIYRDIYIYIYLDFKIVYEILFSVVKRIHVIINEKHWSISSFDFSDNITLSGSAL